MKKIIMFTGDNCPKCKRAKAMLESVPVDVEIMELNVDSKIEDKKEGGWIYPSDSMACLKALNSSTLPTFAILKEGKDVALNEENYHVYRGFDEHVGKIMDYLEL